MDAPYRLHYIHLDSIVLLTTPRCDLSSLLSWRCQGRRPGNENSSSSSVIDFLRCGIIQFKLLPDLQCFPFAYAIALFLTSALGEFRPTMLTVWTLCMFTWHWERIKRKFSVDSRISIRADLDCEGRRFDFLLKINYWFGSAATRKVINSQLFSDLQWMQFNLPWFFPQTGEQKVEEFFPHFLKGNVSCTAQSFLCSLLLSSSRHSLK